MATPWQGRRLRFPRLDHIGLGLGAGTGQAERSVEPGGGEDLGMLTEESVGNDEFGATEVDAEVDEHAVAALFQSERAGAGRPVEAKTLRRVGPAALADDRAYLDLVVATHGAPGAPVLLQLQVEAGARVRWTADDVRSVEIKVDRPGRVGVVQRGDLEGGAARLRPRSATCEQAQSGEREEQAESSRHGDHLAERHPAAVSGERRPRDQEYST